MKDAKYRYSCNSHHPIFRVEDDLIANVRNYEGGDEILDALILAQAMLDPENQPPQYTVEEAMSKIAGAIQERLGELNRDEQFA